MIDSAGNAYIAGSTSSYYFPTTSGAFNTANTYGVPMVFVTKLNAAGQRASLFDASGRLERKQRQRYCYQ